MANIKVQVIEFRPVKVEYKVEASTIQEALNKVADGEGGNKKIISMPDMTDDPYELDEESFWQVDIGDGFEYVHDIGDMELERVIEYVPIQIKNIEEIEALFGSQDIPAEYLEIYKNRLKHISDDQIFFVSDGKTISKKEYLEKNAKEEKI